MEKRGSLVIVGSGIKSVGHMTIEAKGWIDRPLLPRDQKPPIDLNRATMDKYRPRMQRHYLVERPVFG